MVQRDQAAGDTAGQHALPPHLGPHTGGPGHQLCVPPLGAGWAQAAMLQPERERTSEGQRPEAEEAPPQGWGRAGPPSCSSFPTALASQGPQRRPGGKTGLPGTELDTGVPNHACPVALAEGSWRPQAHPDPGLGSRGGDNGSALSSSHHLKPAPSLWWGPSLGTSKVTLTSHRPPPPWAQRPPGRPLRHLPSMGPLASFF